MTRNQRLTEAAISKIATPDHRDEISAGDGLYLVVQPKSGSKSWALRYRKPGGGWAKLTLGSWPEITLKDARKKAHAALGRVGEGEDPAKAKAHQRAAARRVEGDVESAVDDFAKFYEKNHRSAGDVVKSLRRHAVPAWEGRRLTDITTADVRRLILAVNDGTKDVDGHPFMANRLLAHLQALFKWALERERVTASPIIGIRKPGDEPSRDRYLSDDELPDVLRAIERESYPWSPMFGLLLGTGQRKNEVAKAKRSELNLPRREWTIPRQRAKNMTAHVVPLTDEAVAIIEALPVVNGSDYLFPAMRGGKKTVSGFGRAKARLDKIMTEIRAERGEGPLPEWRVHDLRRTVATGLERLGVPLPVTEAVLGHTSGSKKGVVAVYQRHEYREEKRRALETWARHLDGLRHPASAVNVVALRSGAV